MKGKYIGLGVLLLSFLSVVVIWFQRRSFTYEQALTSFQSIRMDEVPVLIAETDKALLYVGRESCPYCVDFVHLADEEGLGDGIPSFALDSSLYEEDPDYLAFKEAYSQVYVPALYLISKGYITPLQVPQDKEAMDTLIQHITMN